MKKTLYEAYKYAQTHTFSDEEDKMYADDNIQNLLQNMSDEDFRDEIALVYKYLDFLKLQHFYSSDDDMSVYGDVAFTPRDIYRLWLEKDLAIYSVLAGCTDDYIQDIIEYWISKQYDYEAINMITHYRSMRADFRDK